MYSLCERKKKMHFLPTKKIVKKVVTTWFCLWNCIENDVLTLRNRFNKLKKYKTDRQLTQKSLLVLFMTKIYTPIRFEKGNKNQHQTTTSFELFKPTTFWAHHHQQQQQQAAVIPQPFHHIQLLVRLATFLNNTQQSHSLRQTYLRLSEKVSDLEEVADEWINDLGRKLLRWELAVWRCFDISKRKIIYSIFLVSLWRQILFLVYIILY